MPSSRSAKEICREFGEKDIACKVARSRERRRKKREEQDGTATSPPPPPPPPPPPAKPATERGKYLEEKISGEVEGT